MPKSKPLGICDVHDSPHWKQDAGTTNVCAHWCENWKPVESAPAPAELAAEKLRSIGIHATYDPTVGLEVESAPLLEEGGQVEVPADPCPKCGTMHWSAAGFPEACKAVVAGMEEGPHKTEPFCQCACHEDGEPWCDDCFSQHQRRDKMNTEKIEIVEGDRTVTVKDGAAVAAIFYKGPYGKAAYALAVDLATKLRGQAAGGESQLEPVRDFHYEDAQVMDAIVGTDYLKSSVQNRLNFMTSGEKWSLYRAIAKLSQPSPQRWIAERERLRTAETLISEVLGEFHQHRFVIAGSMPVDGSCDTGWMKRAEQFLLPAPPEGSN
jgi:hypothetical protein